MLLSIILDFFTGWAHIASEISTFNVPRPSEKKYETGLDIMILEIMDAKLIARGYA